MGQELGLNPDVKPNPDVKVPEGYVHYGPANGGVTLPAGVSFADSMLRGGYSMSTGQNPYFPTGSTGRDELSLGGSPSQPLPPVSTLPKEGADAAGGLPTIITNPGSAIGRPGGSLSLGGGGVQGPAQTPAVDWSLFKAPLRDAYGSSSNRDFYRKQFQDMEGQQNVQKFKEFAAALRANEAQNKPAPAPTDPWAWANLPKVQTGGTVAATPIEWGLNPAYGINSGMTNQQATGAMSSVLTPEESAMMAQHWKDNPTGATQNNWLTAGSPNVLQGQLAGGISPEFTNTLQKVFNNIYTQTGGGTGGVSVPNGYANPVPQG